MEPDVSVVQRPITDGVGHITLNRPERLNAVTTELAQQLEVALVPEERLTALLDPSHSRWRGEAQEPP
jgi:hypothetical protein